MKNAIAEKVNVLAVIVPAATIVRATAAAADAVKKERAVVGTALFLFDGDGLIAECQARKNIAGIKFPAGISSGKNS